MTDITPYLNRADMLQETAEQIIKDFGMLGMEIKISQASNTTYPELFSVLLPLIEKLQKKNTQSFSNATMGKRITQTGFYCDGL